MDKEQKKGTSNGFIIFIIISLLVGLVILIGIVAVGIFIFLGEKPQPTATPIVGPITEPTATPTPAPTASMPVSGYSFMKAHDIGGSPDGALSDYQVKFVVHRGQGTDAGQDVYLGGHSLSWPDDVRLTDNSSVPLSYWIESYDPEMATVWVKVASLPAAPGTATVKLYYGKAGDAGASDGNATFVFFDDFNGSSYTDKWQTGAGSWVEANGVLTRASSSSDGSLYVKNETIGNGAIRCRFRQTLDASADNPSGGIIARASGPGNPDDGYQFEINRVSGNEFGIRRINGWTPVVLQPGIIKLNQWYVLDAMMYDDSLKMGLDGTVIPGSNTAISSGKYGVRFWDARGDIDWYLVRNYTRNEPKHEAWGAETPA